LQRRQDLYPFLEERGPELRGVAAVHKSVQEKLGDLLISIIPYSVAYLIRIIQVKRIVRKRIPGMIGYGHEDAVVIYSQLIYDQTSVIAGASRKIGEQLADNQSFRGKR
jgi:hypothetical protein